MAELKYKEITEKIIGAAMKVHAALGNGFQEVFYQRALKIELKEISVSFEREFNMPVFYKNQQIGERRVDFLVEGKIINFGSISLQFKRLQNPKFVAYPFSP